MNPCAHITLTQWQPPRAEQTVQATLVLSAEERQKTRYQCQASTGEALLLHLPRGIALAEGDLLTTDLENWWVRVQAKAEPVLVVRAKTPLELLRAAYHLGNRHVPLELSPERLKLSVDSVLQKMLIQQGLTVNESLEPFHPEVGAYRPHPSSTAQ